MNKFFFCSIFFFGFFQINQLKAQSYIPVPDSNAVWIEGSFLYWGYGGHEHATLTQPLIFGNDTSLGGNTYHTLHGHLIADWIDGWGNQQTYQDGTDYLPDQLRVIFRQDIPNKKVYQWDPSNQQEVLMYDFAGLVVGQPYPATFNNLNYPQLLVMAYDSVQLNDGLYHERWILGSNSLDSGFVSIIEGVGSSMGFDLQIGLPFEQSSATLCFSKDGNFVYDGWANANGLIPPRYAANCSANVSVEEIRKDEWNILLWPNPVSDVLRIQSESPLQQVVVYNMWGEVVLKKSLNNLTNAELNVAELASGHYLIQCISADLKSINRLIVK